MEQSYSTSLIIEHNFYFVKGIDGERGLVQMPCGLYTGCGSTAAGRYLEMLSALERMYSGCERAVCWSTYRGMGEGQGEVCVERVGTDGARVPVQMDLSWGRSIEA